MNAVPRLRTGIVVLIGIAVAMFAVGVAVPTFKVGPFVAGIVCPMLAATSLSVAGRFVDGFLPFRSRPVEIRIWGEALPGCDGACTIESIRVIGAGLHLYVTHHGGRVSHLKIAQPRFARMDKMIAEIGEASYVQWEAKKRPRTTNGPAVTITIRE